MVKKRLKKAYHKVKKSVEKMATNDDKHAHPHKHHHYMMLIAGVVLAIGVLFTAMFFVDYVVSENFNSPSTFARDAVTGMAVLDTCMDPDNGLDITSKTTVTYGGDEYTDSCFGRNAVIEHVCSTDPVSPVVSTVVDCGKGVCFKGRCAPFSSK